ncbi:MAG: hypothetical protein KZQ93_17080 [Candidatus Thiodiazotropha sp. (ex Monitilora ramsayi)]|nr:hypothetical protein [Candidatus Thiodiazotropha sp. (ex Monitilora ramsayi)]
MNTSGLVMNKSKVLAITFMGLMIGSLNAYSAYQPPIGVPAPSFGIDNVAPDTPANWNSDVAGFYYVRSGGSNSGNGYPGNPRSTIPDPLAAGSVVIVEGTYTTKHETNKLTVNGTASSPVYIRGTNDTNRAVLKQKVVVEGSYYVIEYIDGQWDNSSYNGKLHLTGDHGVVRYGDFRGDTNGCVGGVHIDSGASYTVLYQNNIHHAGDVNASTDQDCHGTRVSPNVNNLWILENEYSYNSGDGVQINAGSSGNDSIHHIYLGRNKAHHNKQTGLWTKQARDVIFSENEVYGHVSSGSSMGEGLGMQYAPDYVWFIFNSIHDNESGIRLASDSGGTGTEHFIVGNEFYNIHKSGSYDSSNSWEVASVAVWGSTNTYVVGNTFWDVDAGINSPRARGKIEIINNIFDAPSASGANQIFFYENLINSSPVDYNVFLNTVTLRLGSSSQIDLAGLQSIHGKGYNSYAVDSLAFVSSANGSFIPSLTSAAAENGTSNVDVYQIFYNRYGIDISKDITGAPRVMDSNPEIGAYEITGDIVSGQAPPSPPILSAE